MPLDKIAANALIYAGGAAFSALVSSGNNAWSASENRKSSENISRLNRDSSEEIARLSRKHSAELQYNQLKFSVLQQRENQEFQRELAELNHERAKEIEAFRAKVSHAINQKNLDFQKWRFEQEKKIQYDILQLQQDFQRDLVRLQHQNAVELMRERLRSDKSPIANLPFDLLENSFAHGVMPLKLFLAPPFLDHDPSTGKPLTSGYETYLAEEIEQFLHQGYLVSHHHPVQLVDRAWESKKWGGSSALQALHGQLKSIPVLVLESDINLGDLLNFKLGYWSAGDVSYTKATILSGQSYSDLLYSIAKNRALEWEKTRQKLQEIGKDEAFIKEKGGLNEENLQILYKELAEKAEFEEHGLDLTVKKDYKLSNLDYRAFYQYLAVWHCLVIGLYADILFLGNSWENTPLLPSLIPYLLEKYKNHPLLTPEFWQEGIATIVKAYGRFYDSLESDSASCSPEIRMKLALSLANLPDAYKYLALEQGNSALCHWLKANNAPTDKVFDIDSDDDIRLFKRIIYQEYMPFLESLKLLSEQVKDAENIDINQLSKVNSVLQQWRSLVRFGNIPHLPALVTEGESMTVEQVLNAVQTQVTGKMPVAQISPKTAKADFTQLDQYLKNGQWREASNETGDIINQIAGRTASGWLMKEDCQNFPHEELQIIDSLWVKYSNGKFGFSVQKKIWLECGGEVGVRDFHIWRKFADKVGWRKLSSSGNWLPSQYVFNMNPPQGHFPLWVVVDVLENGTFEELPVLANFEDDGLLGGSLFLSRLYHSS
ncbi:MAG: GUN4 domain-containing protein [Microcystis aeruginosa W13-11]|nr:GUN4 domain-containing protein [Microcystis aeruginosa W13-11]